MMNDFYDFVESAAPGDKFVYHTGLLAKDAFSGDEDKRQKTPAFYAAHRLEMLRNMVWRSYEDGKVHLVQRRIGPNDFEYIAVRSSKR